MAKRQIVIIGGGFSGTALAIQLLRRADAQCAITLIEPRAELAEGVAYSTQDPVHRINVPAARMQLSQAEKGDFDRWYRQQSAFQHDSDALWQDDSVYPQRRQFAVYLRDKLQRALHGSVASFRHIKDYADDYQSGQVITRQGRVLPVDQLVLAISHPAPTIPSEFQPLSTDPRLIVDPWQSDQLSQIDPLASLAIIGTGLTMSDVVASLVRQGHRGKITAISRRGQLPRANLSGDYAEYSLPEAPYSPMTAPHWLRFIRQQVRLAALQQLPWQVVLDDVRRQGQTIWQQLSVEEQRRFQRHLRPWWDVHRYRIAPQVSAVVEDYLASTQLKVYAARITAVQRISGQITLALALRHGGRTELAVDKVILTTGPAHQALISSQPLLQSLAKQRLIMADPLGLGIAVSAQSQAMTATGDINRTIFVVGPAARGRFGELMGLPQVAEHAEFIAAQLTSDNERCPSFQC